MKRARESAKPPMYYFIFFLNLFFKCRRTRETLTTARRRYYYYYSSVWAGGSEHFTPRLYATSSVIGKCVMSVCGSTCERARVHPIVITGTTAANGLRSINHSPVGYFSLEKSPPPGNRSRVFHGFDRSIGAAGVSADRQTFFFSISTRNVQNCLLKNDRNFKQSCSDKQPLFSTVF